MKTRFLAFGVLLGGAVGVIASSIEILVWISEGRPALLIRRGWGGSSYHFYGRLWVDCGLLVWDYTLMGNYNEESPIAWRCHSCESRNPLAPEILGSLLSKG